MFRKQARQNVNPTSKPRDNTSLKNTHMLLLRVDYFLHILSCVLLCHVRCVYVLALHTIGVNAGLQTRMCPPSAAWRGGSSDWKVSEPPGP